MSEHPKTPLVIATRNLGKIAEFSTILEPYPVLIKTLDDFGPIPNVEEDGETFEENAYKKASFTARILGLPALADDSGLAIEALDGAPGVHSARFAGKTATDENRCQKILTLLADKKNRRAAFMCVLSIAVPSGPALTYEGECLGQITQSPQGSSGFGYDPIFYYPPLKKTFAQMNREEKNRISHRGKAMNELGAEFDKVLIWIARHTTAPERIPCKVAGQNNFSPVTKNESSS